MKKNKLVIFMLCIIILTSCLVIIAVVYSFVSGGASCRTNPLVYGAENLYENNGEEFVCGCYPLNYISNYKRFFFDREGLYAENPDSNSLILPWEVNWFRCSIFFILAVDRNVA